MTTKRLIALLASACILVLAGSQWAVAEDTKTLVRRVCTECHDAKKDAKTGQAYWDGQKKTKTEWAKVVNKMQMWGAQLTDQEGDLVVEYLTAMSKGVTKRSGSDVRPEKPKATPQVSIKTIKIKPVAKATTTTRPPAAKVAQAPTTNTTLSHSAATSTPLTEQAETGVEMIWYLLGGGMMVGSGMALRNRDKRLNGDE